MSCTAVFDEVLSHVGSIVRLTTEYIANPGSSGVKCKHGESECKGNKQQLCARSIVDERQAFNFVLCQRTIPALSAFVPADAIV